MFFYDEWAQPLPHDVLGGLKEGQSMHKRARARTKRRCLARAMVPHALQEKEGDVSRTDGSGQETVGHAVALGHCEAANPISCAAISIATVTMRSTGANTRFRA